MNNDHALTTIKDRLAQVRDSLGEAHPSIPASEIIARARRRRVRRHLISGTAGVLALAAGAAVAVTALSASHPASPQPRVQLAAWTVVPQPGGIIHVTVRELRDPAGLQDALRADGVPASVSFGNGQQTACLPYPGGGFRTSGNLALINSVFTPGSGKTLPGVSIRPAALPSGTGVLLAFSQSSKHGVPFVAIEVAVVQASQQCTGS